MSIRIVRLGTARLPDEGLRIGTVRRPPRGVPKADSPAAVISTTSGCRFWRPVSS